VSGHVTHSEAETSAVGRALGATLRAGDILLLHGPLGAGKTAFVRGVAEGLGSNPDDVSSPTFTIIQEYAARVPVRHVDLYRLTPLEVDDLGLEDLMEDGVVAVEWPERWTSAPADATTIRISPIGDTDRRIEIYRDSTR
jgi:tRNA threonylcarbamoyladenosine biosynthesis protein TsaE